MTANEGIKHEYELSDRLKEVKIGVDSMSGVAYTNVRPPLRAAMEQMELILRKHDHKKLWVEYPIEALMRHMRIELEEFQVALEFHTVAEARHEILDVMNYMFFLWDRLGIEPQDKIYVKAEKAK